MWKFLVILIRRTIWMLPPPRRRRDVHKNINKSSLCKNGAVLFFRAPNSLAFFFVYQKNIFNSVRRSILVASSYSIPQLLRVINTKWEGRPQVCCALPWVRDCTMLMSQASGRATPPGPPDKRRKGVARRSRRCRPARHTFYLHHHQDEDGRERSDNNT